jgi:hypothetical protein
MGEIAWRRVVLGGLLAGVVMFLSSAVVNALMSEVIRASMSELGSEFADPAGTPPAGAMAVFAVEYLLLGITAIWLYASIRPRFGPGPLTAAMAGFAIWLILEIHGLSLVVITGLTLRTYIASSAPYVVVQVVSAIVGASIYREDLGESRTPLTASAT